MGFLKMLGNCVLSPEKAFKDADILSSLLLSLLGSFSFSSSLFLILRNSNILPINEIWTLLSFMLLFLLLFVLAPLFHILAKLFGGKGNLKATFSIVSISIYFPLLFTLPLTVPSKEMSEISRAFYLGAVSLILFVYSLALFVQGFCSSHLISPFRAVMLSLLPILIFSILSLLLLYSILVTPLSMLGV